MIKALIKIFPYSWIFIIGCVWLPIVMYAAPDEIFSEVDAAFEGTSDSDVTALATKLKNLPDPNIIDEQRGRLLNHIIYCGKGKPRGSLGETSKDPSASQRVEGVNVAKVKKRIKVRTQLIQTFLENNKLDINKTDEYEFFTGAPLKGPRSTPLFELCDVKIMPIGRQ